MIDDKEEKVATNIILTREQYEWLRGRAYRHNQSQGSVVRDLIDIEMERDGGEKYAD